MPPRSTDTHHHDDDDDLEIIIGQRNESLLEQAFYELQRMKITQEEMELQPFPIACSEWIKTLPGNDRCADCGQRNPDWAAVSHGALICVHCCGRHRSLGVNYSKVRSLTLDHWSYEQVLKMMEGGNEQLGSFFGRHELSSTCGQNGQTNLKKRYLTKAAKFYREGMEKHVEKISASGFYRGREASRRERKPSKSTLGHL